MADEQFPRAGIDHGAHLPAVKSAVGQGHREYLIRPDARIRVLAAVGVDHIVQAGPLGVPEPAETSRARASRDSQKRFSSGLLQLPPRGATATSSAFSHSALISTGLPIRGVNA